MVTMGRARRLPISASWWIETAAFPSPVSTLLGEFRPLQGRKSPPVFVEEIEFKRLSKCLILHSIVDESQAQS